jgi:dTDP-4-dehydrorhamnose reductase
MFDPRSDIGRSTMKRSLLITGGSGLLGLNWALAARDRFGIVLAMHEREIRVAGAATRRIDLASADDLQCAIDETNPVAVIHTAGMTNVDSCERDPARARHVNVEISWQVAAACARAGVALAHISTDHLFSGSRVLVTEVEPVSPVNVYARTKADAEARVLDAHPGALVVRTNFFGWGPVHRRSFSDVIITALRERKPLTLFDDVFYTPILMANLIEAVHGLIERRAAGVFHVVGDERVSKYEFGRRIAAAFGLDDSVLGRGQLAGRPDLARRPKEMSLSNDKARQVLGQGLGTIDEQLQRLLRQEEQGLAREVLNP